MDFDELRSSGKLVSTLVDVAAPRLDQGRSVVVSKPMISDDNEDLLDAFLFKDSVSMQHCSVQSHSNNNLDYKCMEAEKEFLTNSLHDIHSRFNHLEKENQTLQRNARSRVNDLKLELQVKNDKMDEMAKQISIITRIEHDYALLEKQLNDLADTNDDLSYELKERDVEFLSLSQNLVSLTSDNDKLELKIQERLDIEKQLQSQIFEGKQELIDFKANTSLILMKDEIEFRKQEKLRLLARVEELQTRLNTSEKWKDKLHEAVSVAENTNKKNVAMLDEAQRLNELLKRTHERELAQIQGHQMDKSLKRARINSEK